MSMSSLTTWIDRAHSSLATGLPSISEGAIDHPSGQFPFIAADSQGCRIRDSQGKEYVDWLIAGGPVVFGYRDPDIETAVLEQVRRGPLTSLIDPLEIEVAEAIQRIVPCAERVAFGKNGSDATAAAIRIARALTGRDGILVHGFHGFHDWYVARLPEAAGVPEYLRHLIRHFDYNDLSGLEQTFAQHGERIAAVIMEPTNVTAPEPGFLEGIRELANENGSLLIFDEIVTSFRIARGGAQEHFGVVPDLCCLGKAMTNGYPLSAVAGRSDVMAALPRVSYGMTYRGETIALAAARAGLHKHEHQDIAEQLRKIGRRLRAIFEERAATHGIVGGLFGFDARLTVAFSPAGRLSGDGLQRLFVQESLRHGILTNGVFLANVQHDEDSFAITRAALDQAFAVMRQAIDRQDFTPYLFVPQQSSFYVEGRDPELVG